MTSLEISAIRANFQINKALGWSPNNVDIGMNALEYGMLVQMKARGELPEEQTSALEEIQGKIRSGFKEIVTPEMIGKVIMGREILDKMGISYFGQIRPWRISAKEIGSREDLSTKEERDLKQIIAKLEPVYDEGFSNVIYVNRVLDTAGVADLRVASILNGERGVFQLDDFIIGEQFE